MKLIILSLSIMAVIAFTSSCGIKPSKLEGDGTTTFPRTYPDISTDPLSKG